MRKCVDFKVIKSPTPTLPIKGREIKMNLFRFYRSLSQAIISLIFCRYRGLTPALSKGRGRKKWAFAVPQLKNLLTQKLDPYSPFYSPFPFGEGWGGAVATPFQHCCSASSTKQLRLCSIAAKP
ncbi:hypothetical protein HMPREF3034_01123 [Prevotella sp. DNF00663]|nr:hypothetical protein HMPREF3034_01123 [Prevotella sp. DNF00663]